MRIDSQAPIPDWDSVEFALECADPELRSYYDTPTGAVNVTGPFEDELVSMKTGDQLRWRYGTMTWGRSTRGG